MNKADLLTINDPKQLQKYAVNLLSIVDSQSQQIEDYLAKIQHQTIEYTNQIHAIQSQAAEQLTIQSNTIETQQAEIKEKDFKIQALTLELARLKRLKFAQKAETYRGVQLDLFEETLEADIAAAETALQQLVEDKTTAPIPKRQPKRQALPKHLPREQVRHAPADCCCQRCGGALTFIRDEVSEQLEYQPAVFKVIEHIRPQYSCPQCETVVAEPMPAQIIDKGQPGPGLLAQVLIAKYADHCPLYRQRAIYQRSGVELAVSTMAQWVGKLGVWLEPLTDMMRADLVQQTVLHADETPLPMLAPKQAKTKRAYCWAYRTASSSPITMVVYDFQTSRQGKHAQAMLAQFKGALMVDDYAGYKALFSTSEQQPSDIIELGCWAHARRKFYDLHSANKSALAQTALTFIAKLYDLEREAAKQTASQRQQHRQQYAKPHLEQFQKWLIAQRTKIPPGTGTAKAIDYTLKRWPALLRYLEQGDYPIDNNLLENNIRPIALGRKNWLFVGSEPAGHRAAAIMTLINSAKLNGLEPYAYLKDILNKLPTWPYARIRELLPYNWQAAP